MHGVLARRGNLVASHATCLRLPSPSVGFALRDCKGSVVLQSRYVARTLKNRHLLDQFFSAAAITRRDGDIRLDLQHLSLASILQTGLEFKDRSKRSDTPSNSIVDTRDIIQLGISRDGTLENNLKAPACILQRASCFLFALGPLRAIVYHDMAYVLGTNDPSILRMARNVEMFCRVQYQEGLLDEDDPFELLFLDAVLNVVTRDLDHQLQLLSNITKNFVQEIQVAPPNSMIDQLLQLQPLEHELDLLEDQMLKVVHCINDTLHSDSDMTFMLLTALANNRAVDPDSEDHDEVELILEVYHRKLRQSLMEVKRLRNSTKFGWSLSDLKLSDYRAKLDLISIQVSVGALSVGISAAIAGFFGMNVPVPFAQESQAFGAIILCSACAAALISARYFHVIGGGAVKVGQQKMEMAIASELLLANIKSLESALQQRGLCDNQTNSPSSASFIQAVEATLGRTPTDSEIEVAIRFAESVTSASTQRNIANSSMGEDVATEDGKIMKGFNKPG